MSSISAWVDVMPSSTVLICWEVGLRRDWRASSPSLWDFVSLNQAVISFMKAFCCCSLECGVLCLLSRCFQLQRGWSDLHTSVAIAGTFQMSKAHGWVLEVLWSYCCSWCPGGWKSWPSLPSSPSPIPPRLMPSWAQELSTTAIRPMAECRWISLMWCHKLVAQIES